MTRAAFIALALLSAAMGPGGNIARAMDWRLSGAFSQRLSADQGAPDESAAVSSVADIGFSATGQSPTSSVGLSASMRGVASTDEVSDLSTLLPRFSASASRSFGRGQVQANLGFTPRLTDAVETIDSLGVFAPDGGGATDPDPNAAQSPPDRLNRNVSALELAYSAGLGFSWQATPLTSLSIRTFAQARDYTTEAEGLNPTQSYGFNVGMSRRIDPLTSLSLSTSLTRFESEDADPTTSLSLSVGGDRRLTQALTANGRIGVSQTAGGDETSLNMVGDMGLSYATARVRFALRGGQVIDQSEDGTIESRIFALASVGGSLTQNISAGLSLRAQSASPLFDDGGGDGLSLSVSPGLSYRIDRSWSVSVGHQIRFDEDSDAPRNTAFVAVSRSLSLLP